MPGSICARELAKRDDERGHENNYHQFQPFLCQVAPAELDTGDVPNSIRQSLRRHANGNAKMMEVIGPNTIICP